MTVTRNTADTCCGRSVVPRVFEQQQLRLYGSISFSMGLFNFQDDHSIKWVSIRAHRYNIGTCAISDTSTALSIKVYIDSKQTQAFVLVRGRWGRRSRVELFEHFQASQRTFVGRASPLSQRLPRMPHADSDRRTAADVSH